MCNHKVWKFDIKCGNCTRPHRIEFHSNGVLKLKAHKINKVKSDIDNFIAMSILADLINPSEFIPYGCLDIYNRWYNSTIFTELFGGAAIVNGMILASPNLPENRRREFKYGDVQLFNNLYNLDKDDLETFINYIKHHCIKNQKIKFEAKEP